MSRKKKIKEFARKFEFEIYAPIYFLKEVNIPITTQ